MSRQSVLLSVLGGVLVVALWWLFLYSPAQEEIARLDGEIAAAQTESASLQQRVAALQAVRARAPETEAAIAALRSVVPVEQSLPGALRQVQAAADDAGVTLNSISIPRPSIGDDGLARSAVSMAITGSYFQTVDFIRRLEDPGITARALRFSSISTAATDYPELATSITGEMYSVLAPAPSIVEEPAPEPPTPTPAPADEEAAS